MDSDNPVPEQTPDLIKAFASDMFQSAEHVRSFALVVEWSRSLPNAKLAGETHVYFSVADGRDAAWLDYAFRQGFMPRVNTGEKDGEPPTDLGRSAKTDSQPAT